MDLLLVFVICLLLALVFGGIAVHVLWYAALAVLIVAGIVYVFNHTSRGPRV